MDYNLIYAVSDNHVIGDDNQIPWHVPEDLINFQRLTENEIVIMGRKTWESLPDRYRPLPNRRNIVISRNPDLVLEGAEVVCSPAAVIGLLGSVTDKTAWVIGGRAILASFEKIARAIVLTQVHIEVQGDTFAPMIDFSRWVEMNRAIQLSKTGISFEVIRYVKPLL